jgi:hypothetical protein
MSARAPFILYFHLYEVSHRDPYGRKHGIRSLCIYWKYKYWNYYSSYLSHRTPVWWMTNSRI